MRKYLIILILIFPFASYNQTESLKFTVILQDEKGIPIPNTKVYYYAGYPAAPGNPDLSEKQYSMTDSNGIAYFKTSVHEKIYFGTPKSIEATYIFSNGPKVEVDKVHIITLVCRRKKT